MLAALSQWELTVLDWIAVHCRTPWLDAVVPWITWLGTFGMLWIVLTVALLLLRGQRQYGVQTAMALIFGLILCNLIVKNAVGRIRPFEMAGIESLLVALPEDPSFPSGHSTASFAVATVLLMNRHPLRWPVLAVACLIALSRLYLYVHFPTDVAAGALLGVLCGLLSVTLWRRVIQPRLTGDKKMKTAP